MQYKNFTSQAHRYSFSSTDEYLEQISSIIALGQTKYIRVDLIDEKANGDMDTQALLQIYTYVETENIHIRINFMHLHFIQQWRRLQIKREI